MSQFWHANWAEDSFKPTMLGNWQVPNWHPKWPCARHCVKTTFLADKTGRLLAGQPRSKRSPWGDYKGTWELPLKINRRLAQRLSAPPKYQLAAWETHKKHYEGPCGIIPAILRRDKAAERGEKSGKTSNRNITKTRKNLSAKRTTHTNIEEKAANFGKKDDVKTKSADTKNTARKDVAERRIKEPKEGNREKRKIVKEENPEEKILSVSGEKERETVVKDYSEKRLVQETKANESLKCPCTKNNLSPGVIQKTRRKICTIHQRLRV